MGDENSQLESFPVVEPKSKKKTIKRFFKKYGIVLLIVVLLVILAGYAINQRQSTEQAWDKASDYFSRGDYEKAAKELEGMSVPSDEKKLIVFSQTKLATRQLDDALEGYKKLYEEKKDPGVKLIIGNIYNEQKNYQEAEKIYREAIDTNANYTQAYVNLATLYKMQGDIQNAIEVAQQGVKNNPSSTTLHELRVSMLLDDKESPEYKVAIVELEKLNPNDPLLESLRQ